MVKGEHGLFQSTEKAGMTIAGARTYLGCVIWASAAATITIENSGGENILVASTDAAGIIVQTPALPIACPAGIGCTNSGGGYYTVFYGV